MIFQVVKMVLHVMHLWLWQRKEYCRKLESTHQPEMQKPSKFVSNPTRDFCETISGVDRHQDVPAVPRTRHGKVRLFLDPTLLKVCEQEFYFLWVEWRNLDLHCKFKIDVISLNSFRIEECYDVNSIGVSLTYRPTLEFLLWPVSPRC